MSTKPKESNKRSLQDFRAAHDKSFIIPNKVREGLKQLGSGWEYEVEFLRRCGVCTTDLSRYRDGFEDYIVMTAGRNPKRIWTGSKEMANKMREMVEQNG